MSGVDPVEVFSILGNEYSVKAPAGEQHALLQAFSMLERTLAETKRQYPALVSDRLLVLTALNLCQRQMQLQEALDLCQARVEATVATLADTLQPL